MCRGRGTPSTASYIDKHRLTSFVIEREDKQNVPAASVPAQHYDQQPQPALPSYAEAMRTAAPPTFNYPRTVDQETYHPSAPLYNTPAQSVPIHPQYPSQPNYTQTGYPATICTYPPSYATNAYSPYGQTSDDCPGGPTTIHIIRPMPVESSACCSGTKSRILGVILGLVLLGAIIRGVLNASL